MRSFRSSRLWRLARVAAVLWLCLGTPAVLDIVVQTAGSLSGNECCADECEETGEPCTQQCVHCVCGGHNVTLPSVQLERPALAHITGEVDTQDRLGARSGHLEPLFRPPVG